MTCPNCQAASETDGLSSQYNSPQCECCTARLIKRISKLPIAQSEATARMKAVLADATAYGHQEAPLRARVKSGPWLADVEIKKRKG